MIHLKQAVVVEGKYDKIKLAGFVDAPIITTEGFGVFKSQSKKNLIRFMAKKRGIVILTDSDRAGQLIRNHIKSFIGEGKIYCAYIPKIFGKEKRKSSFSKEGFLGVEAMSESMILCALKKAGVFLDSVGFAKKFTNLHLLQVGLLGSENSKEFRKKFLNEIGLPDYLSTKQLLEVLNATFTVDEFNRRVVKLKRGMV